MNFMANVSLRFKLRITDYFRFKLLNLIERSVREHERKLVSEFKHQFYNSYSKVTFGKSCVFQKIAKIMIFASQTENQQPEILNNFKAYSFVCF